MSAGDASTPTPDDIVLALLDRREVERSVWREGTSPAMLAAAMRIGDARVRAGAASNDNATPDLLARAAADPQCDVRVVAARRRETPVDSLSRMRSDRSKYVRRAVAANPSTARDDLGAMVGDHDAEVRRRLARADVSAAAIETLSRDRSPWIRAQVASRRDLDRVVAERLATDPSADVRMAVAARPLRNEVLAVLATDVNPIVARTVATSPFASPATLRIVAAHPHPTPRIAVAVRAGHEDWATEMLADDPDLVVRSAIAQRTRMTGVAERLADDPAPYVRGIIAGRDDAGPDVLARLVNDRSSRVRGIVMANPRCPVEVIASNLASPQRTVRDAARRHLTERGAFVPPADRRPFSTDRSSLADHLWWADTVTDEATLAAALRDPATPEVVAVAIVRRAGLGEAVLIEGMLSPHATVRHGVAAHPDAPERILRTLANDRSIPVRRAVADHANTDAGTLRRLCRDPHASVAQTARGERGLRRWRQLQQANRRT